MLQNLIDSGREAQRTGAWDEALAHYESALALLADGSDPRQVADLHRWIGSVNLQRGNLDDAHRNYQTSLEVAEAAGLGAAAVYAAKQARSVRHCRAGGGRRLRDRRA